MENFIGIILVIGMGLFAYVSTVIVHEEKTGKRIPLIWDKDFWNSP